MIFSELYSAYYNTVARILSAIMDDKTDERVLNRIVMKYAFDESVLTILPSMKSGKWQIMHPDFTTPIIHRPTMPMTNLEKRWLKAISLDPRIKLFGLDFSFLDDVEPLFTPDDYYVFDKYLDGDPFDDEKYIERFRLILYAIREGKQIKFTMKNRRGNDSFVRCRPLRLEYSEKDDKLRLITGGCRYVTTVNLSRISKCAIDDGAHPVGWRCEDVKQQSLTLKLSSARNTPERLMLHFAHFEKQAQKLADDTYLVKIKYEANDEPEMVIRVLSFGPTVEVVEPEGFRELVREKLKKQKNCGLK